MITMGTPANEPELQFRANQRRFGLTQLGLVVRSTDALGNPTWIRAAPEDYGLLDLFFTRVMNCRPVVEQLAELAWEVLKKAEGRKKLKVSRQKLLRLWARADDLRRIMDGHSAKSWPRDPGPSWYGESLKKTPGDDSYAESIAGLAKDK